MNTIMENGAVHVVNGHLPWTIDHVHRTRDNGHLSPSPKEPELLRRLAWEIGEKRPADTYRPTVSHTALAMVTPGQAFAHWTILPEWVEQTQRLKADAWHQCRLLLRLYDVSYIEFNGTNAHRIRDYTLPGLCGQMMLPVHAPGTYQMGEVGFLLRNGEFLAAARSETVCFSRDHASPRHEFTGLIVSPSFRVDEVGNVWDQEQVIRERCRPRLRQHLRIAAFAFTARALGHTGLVAEFVSSLAAGQVSQGHDVHVFLPASGSFTADFMADGVHYHPLDVHLERPPLEQAESFRQAALERLYDFPAFDLLHMHEWMAGLPPRLGPQPVVLSLSSLESTRRNNAPSNELSQSIAEAENEAAQEADCILTPAWLRDRALAELAVDSARVHAFPMEGRMPNEWEAALDFGQVKKDIGLGPLDRMFLFVGPLEHTAGVDILLEAVPTLLRRTGNMRVAFAGGGPMHGHLQHRAHELGVAGAVRFLGHVERPLLIRLLRSAEALVLPARGRVPYDDAVVDLARRAGRAVVTTHGGPAYLVRHDETGLLTYDNPGSIVWAIDRILGNPGQAEQMGKKGQRSDTASVAWSDVARLYLELCAAHFSELNQIQWE